MSELETTVELGCQLGLQTTVCSRTFVEEDFDLTQESIRFFVKALIPDTSCILVDVGAMHRAPWPRKVAESCWPRSELSA